MNVSLGAPFEAIIERMVERGYAASGSEVIRQALLLLERETEMEELVLVHKGVEAEMERMRQSGRKPVPLKKIIAKYRK